MNDPWTWATVWGLTWKQGVGRLEESKGGKIGTIIERQNIYIKKVSIKM